MSKYPVFQQYESIDCGSTCLAMICEYYGKHYKVEYLRDLCYTNREGVSLYSISMASEKLGFHTVGVKVTISELRQDKFLPCILYWNQNHFVVLYRIKKTSKGLVFYVANPAIAVVSQFNEEEFGKCFLNSVNNQGKGLGIALYLSPSNTFFDKENVEGQESNKKSLGFLFSYLIPYKKHFLLLFLILLIGTGIQMLLPFMTQATVDQGIHDRNINIVIMILAGQMTLEIGSAFMSFFRNWIMLKVGTKINISLISDYLTKLMRLPISFFDSKQTGDILQRLNDHSRIQNFITNSSLDTFFSTISIVVLGIVIFIYDWLVSLMFFVGSALYIIWIWIFLRWRAILDGKTFAQKAANQSNMIQVITGMQEIKLNGCEHNKRWEWESIQRKIYRLSMQSLKLSQYQQTGGIFIYQAKNLIITGFVATLVIHGKITLGMMLSVQYIVGMLNSPVEQLISFIRQFQDAKLSVDRLQDVYHKEDEDDKNSLSISDEECGDIKLNSVSFKYDKYDANTIIDNVSLSIPKGKTTAIVGLSGSGKTTLLKLIIGFYKPDKGFISVGKKSLDKLNMQDWRKKCGTVMQDGFIFSDTIARNIAPSATSIDMDRVKEAAKIANIADFVENLPLRYDTKIGNEGHGLSLGQKQRILIARAVYKNPKYILLDEATNSLDANNEHEIMEHLNSFIKGRTAIVIAHRLSTVRDADNIVVLENGQISEQGSHEMLVEKKGLYYTLIKNQLNI